MKVSQVYQILTEFREAQKANLYEPAEIDLIIEFCQDLLEVDREQFLENYNRWLEKREERYYRMGA